MDYIEFLGTCGTRTATQGATCIKIAKHTVIDAGNLINSSMEDITQINNIFLTHAHLDHISDIPFLIEEVVVTSTKALKIYALKETIEALKSYVFNNEIWPDFSKIKLLNGRDNTIEFIEIDIDTIYEMEDFSIMPVKTNHTDGSCGYIVKKDKQGIFITADTHVSDEVWDKLNKYTWIHSLCIDVSFSSNQEQLAYDSKHLTPKLLSEELKKLKRDNLSIYPMHLKPFFYKQIVDELSTYKFMKSNNSKILLDGDKIYFDKKRGVSHAAGDKVDILISKLTNVSVALSAEKNINYLLELILSEAKKMTNADGGTLYLLNQKSKMLEFKVVQTDSLNIKMGGKSGEITWNALPLYHEDGSKNSGMVAVVSALEDKIINIEDVYHTDSFDFSGTKSFDEQTGYRSQSMLVIPLRNHEDIIIGVLQLINKKGKYSKTTIFSLLDEKVANALASEAAVALTKQQLIDDLENLLESFLHSINIAIEKKSKYTAGHIEKMVEITIMLAEAVNADKSVFEEKNYSEQELKQIRLAALMHDVGKISTPEYVVDKATKLQTIYDRIESVKPKAEIRKRDLEIEYLKKSIDTSKEQKEVLHSNYLAAIDKIDKELLFLEDANSGSEFFNDENIEKVRDIAKSKIDIDGANQNRLSSDEVMNLTVQKGTLNSDEREIINNHATVSLEMLKELPFPQKYARVPEIAAAHHEQINGKGYPLGLKGDDISFEARILAVADIFEALTASDRPYKEAKKLSESMKILYFMAKDNHVDRDIVKFLYESGLYLKIAKKIIPKEYIDECFIDFKY